MTWNKFCGIIALFSVPLCIIGRLADSHNTVLLAAVLIFSCNIIYGLQKPQERIVFLCFLGMIFLFLLGRPVISFFRSYKWWIADGTISFDGGMFAISILFFALCGMFFAAIVEEISHKNLTVKATCSYTQSTFIKNLELVSWIVFWLSIPSICIEGFERLAFMQTHTYLDYFKGEYVTKQPYIVKGFIQLMKPSMCIFLATFPKKKRTFWVLFAYLLSTLPTLRVGTRNPTMLACLFIFIYYIFRDNLRQSNEPQWFGRAEKIIVLVSLPFIVCFLLVYTELRNGVISSVNAKIQHPLSNFIFEQGRTFNLLGEYYDAQDKLPQIGFPGFFLGSLHDSFLQNGLIQQLTGISFPVGQSIERLEIGKALNHHLSYAILGDGYLLGHGLDSSFILDVHADFGKTGVFVFSFFLSKILLNIPRYCNKNWLQSTFIYMALLVLMFIPRASALYPLGFIISPYTWFTVGICWFGAKILTPKYIPREEPRPIG